MPRLRLLVILNHADLPPLARDSLVAAGVVPPLVALLGRWESFKVAGPGGAGGAPGGEPVLLALELMWGIAVLAERKAVAEATGIEEHRVLKWANMCDLMRISGVGEEYSELLEAAGVDTVKELKHRKPDNLHAKMVEVNEGKHLVRQTPSLKSVTDWVEQAKVLTPMLTY